MASRASVGSIDAGLSATAYALATEPTDKHAIAIKVKSGLENGSVKLSYVVLSMQDLVFDHSDPDKKSGEAMAYLVAILKELRKDVLSRADISLLTQFLQANVKNDPSRFKQSCQALQSLAAMTRFTSKSASDMVSDIYTSSGETFSTQAATARFEAYKLLNQLLNSHRKVIRGMGVYFIRIIDSLATTERDPRNLMLVFTMIEVILNEWEQEDIAEMAEGLYDTLQRYFPISFRPKSGDPLTISAEDLILKLRGCFASYSGFAPQLFHDLIQRLDDPNRLNAKADVLETMAACILRYEPAVAAKWSTKLWDALKYEIFNSTDDSQAPNALKVMTTVAARLSLGHNLQTVKGSPLEKYINVVTGDSLTRIREEGQKSSKSAGQILGAVGCGSPYAYHLVVRAVIPELLGRMENNDVKVLDKRTALEVINQLLDARLDKGKVEEDWDFLVPSEVDAGVGLDEMNLLTTGNILYYGERLTSAYMGVARVHITGEEQYRITAIQGLAKILHIPALLDDLEIRSYIEYFTETVSQNWELGDNIRKEALRALQDAIEVFPDEVIDSALPILDKAFPEQLSDLFGNEAYNGNKALAILAAMGDLVAKSSRFLSLLTVLEQKLDSVIRKNTSQRPATFVLSGILYAVEQHEKHGFNVPQDEIMYEKTLADFARRLLQSVKFVKLDSDSKQDNPYNGVRDLELADGKREQPHDFFIELVGKIIMTCLRCSTTEELEKADFDEHPLSLQPWIPSTPLGKQLKSDELTEEYLINQYDTAALLQFTADQLMPQGLRGNAQAESIKALTLTKYVVAGLPREYSLQIDLDAATTRLCEFLATYTPPPNDSLTLSSLLDLVALLVNKHSALASKTDADAVKKILAMIDYDFEPTTDDEQERHLQIRNKIRILATITQAACLAGNKHTVPLLHSLLSGISSPRLKGQCSAQAVHSIFSPSTILTTKNHCVVRAISKQKMYSVCLSFILEKYSAAEDDRVKSNLLVALGGVLKNVKGEMIMPDIDRVLPLLLESITDGSKESKIASLDVLRIAAIESSTAVEGHVSGIVKRLLSCLDRLPEGQRKSKCTPETRVKALEALGVLPKCLRLQVILPHKKTVVKVLRDSSEDPSRKVREAVVNCQMVWWKLASGEDDD